MERSGLFAPHDVAASFLHQENNGVKMWHMLKAVRLPSGAPHFSELVHKTVNAGDSVYGKRNCRDGVFLRLESTTRHGLIHCVLANNWYIFSLHLPVDPHTANGSNWSGYRKFNCRPHIQTTVQIQLFVVSSYLYSVGPSHGSITTNNVRNISLLVETAPRHTKHIWRYCRRHQFTSIRAFLQST